LRQGWAKKGRRITRRIFFLLGRKTRRGEKLKGKGRCRNWKRENGGKELN
jgi:hypothetical protein